MQNNMMKDFVEIWENNMTKYMDEMVKSQSFMKNFLTTYEPVFDITKNVKKQREDLFESVGMASKKDVDTLSQKVQDLEIKMSDILEKLEDNEDNTKEMLKALNSISQELYKASQNTATATTTTAAKATKKTTKK